MSDIDFGRCFLAMFAIWVFYIYLALKILEFEERYKRDFDQQCLIFNYLGAGSNYLIDIID